MRLLRMFIGWINRLRRNGEYEQYRTAFDAFDSEVAKTVKTLKGCKREH